MKQKRRTSKLKYKHAFGFACVCVRMFDSSHSTLTCTCVRTYTNAFGRYNTVNGMKEMNQTSHVHVLVIVIVAISLPHTHLRATHSLTQTLWASCIVFNFTHWYTQPRCTQCTNLLLPSTTCSLLLVSVGHLWRCYRSRNNRLGYGAFAVPLICLCFLFHSIPNWSFNGISVPNGYWRDTDVYVFYGDRYGLTIFSRYSIFPFLWRNFWCFFYFYAFVICEWMIYTQTHFITRCCYAKSENVAPDAKYGH